MFRLANLALCKMGGSKGWAFVSETGSERITAREVSRLRAKVGGVSLGKTYWSTHRVGSRQRLKHVQRKGALPFFSYMDDSVPGVGDGGESLSHELYKHAIARLTKTQLRLKNGSHDIRITYAETEKAITLPTGYYRADVYCRFECDGWLSTKWSGEIYFEVWHEHRVPAEKIEDLKAQRLPVVEVKVSDAYRYRYDGDTTTDEREEQHIIFLVGRLEEFLLGQVLSNPNSVEYLEEKARVLGAKLSKQEKLVIAQTEEVGRLQGAIRVIEGDARSLRAERDALSSKLREERDGLASKLAPLNNKAIVDGETIRSLRGEVFDLKGERTDLLRALKERTIGFFVASGVALLSVVLGIYALLGR